MRRMRLSVILISAVLFSAGCKKDSSSNNNNTADSPSVITFSSPSSVAIYPNGTTLQVRGTITDINGLKSAAVEITNPSGTVLYQANTLTGSVTFYNMIWDWPVSGIVGNVSATVKVTATDYNSKTVSNVMSVHLSD